MRIIILALLIGCTSPETSSQLADVSAENDVHGQVANDASDTHDASDGEQADCCDADSSEVSDSYGGVDSKSNMTVPDVDAGPHTVNETKVPDIKHPDVALDIKGPDTKLPKPDGRGWR